MMNVLRGAAIEPRPVWLMRQAGRYLPEYRETRTKAPDFLSLCLNPKLAAEITLQPIRRFGFDAAILFADILLIPHGLGQKVWFATGEGPKLEPLTPETVKTLKRDQVQRTLAPVFETVARVKNDLPKTTALIGFAGAPWTVATYMIAGGSSDDSTPARLFALRHPSAFESLIECLIDSTADYLIAQVEAGAEVLQIFESWAGTIPADSIETFSIEPIRKIVARVHRHAPAVPIIVFPRGAGAHYPRYANTGAAALSVDAQTSPAWVHAQTKKSVQGNLDPIALIAGGQPLRTAVANLLAETKTTPHIFNLGHGIRPETPLAHVEELLRLIREPH